MLPEHWNATSHMRDCYDKSYWYSIFTPLTFKMFPLFR